MPTLQHQGCALHYDLSGEGAPIVWIQGMGLHGAGWKPQVDFFQRDFQCLTFDNRGMSKSQPASANLSITEMADDVIALMDHVGFEHAHLVGHSMGGLIALAAGLEHRNRVKSLALLCTFADGREVMKPRKEMMWVGMRTMVGTLRMKRLAFLEMVVTQAELQSRDRDELAAELAPIFGHDLGERPPVVMAQLKATSAFDATPRLGELESIPTLVMSAKEDIVAPASWGKSIARGIPQSRYLEVPGAHGLPVSDAPRVNARLCEHFTVSSRCGSQ